MTPTTDILRACRRAGITLQSDGENLKARGPADRMQALLPTIKAHKPELLAALALRPTADLETLACAIANETGLPVANVLALLDENDHEAIRSGSDPGRADAWRCAALALSASPDPIPAPTGTGFPRAVVVLTPSGRPVLAWAETAEQAETLARWNPAPSTAGREGA